MNIKSKIITMHIDIADRHAVYREAPTKLVCGNPFHLIFSFDEEWEEFASVAKKCKIKFWHKGRYEHIIIEFTGTICPVPALFGIKSIEVGVFVENDISTTTGAVIECEKSIRCGESIGVLGADAIDNINAALKGEDGLTPYVGENGNWFIGDADTGVKAEGIDGQNGTDGKDGADGKDGKNGAAGKDGYTPKKRIDYFTDADIAEFLSEVEETITGDIDAALDAILDLQNSLIGGDA